MFNGILNFFKCLNNYAGLIAAIAVILALFFSIYVHVKTQNLLKPTERPIITLYEAKATLPNTVRMDSGYKTVLYLGFDLKNIGKHPAKNVEFKIGPFLKNNPGALQELHNIKIANKIDPDFIFNINYELEKEHTQREIPEESKNLYVYLFIKCKDSLKPGKYFYEEYWFTYELGKEKQVFAIIKEREILEPYVTNLNPERKKIK